MKKKSRNQATHLSPSRGERLRVPGNTQSRIAVLVISLLICGPASSVQLTRTIQGAAKDNPTITNPTSTLSQAIPILKHFVSIPTYSMSGVAIAYEDYDTFENDPKDKVNKISPAGITPQYAPENASENAYAEGRYGNNFGIHDWASAGASFTGTPVGPNVAAGPVSTNAMTGVIATMSVNLETHREGDANEPYAFAVVNDPFHFNGLIDPDTNEELVLHLAPTIEAGLSLTFDTSGAFANEALFDFSGKVTTVANGEEALFRLVIGVGSSSDGLPDIVADFSSHAMLGLDDDAIDVAILDAFAFDTSSSTFSLLADFLLFDAAITAQTASGAFQQEFSLAYMTSGLIGGDTFQGSYQPQYVYDGSGRQRILAKGLTDRNVPLPSSLLLMIAGLPLIARLRRTSQLGLTLATQPGGRVGRIVRRARSA